MIIITLIEDIYANILIASRSYRACSNEEARMRLPTAMIISSANMNASQGMSDGQFCITLSPTHADLTVFGAWLALETDFQKPHRSFMMVGVSHGDFMFSP
jgi:hypothetical protein